MSGRNVQPGEDALTYAKRQVAWYRENAVELMPGNSVRMLAPRDGDRFAERLFAAYLATGRLSAADAAAKASDGDPLFYGALCHLAASELAGEVQLIEPLRSYVIAALRERPRLKRDRRKETNYFRDVCLTMLVQDVCERFNLTWSGSSARRQSGCSIVAEAIGLERATVKKAVAKFINEI